MGKCSVTGRYRPKRAEGSAETVKQRKKRQLMADAKQTVEEVRVVKKKGKKGERGPAPRVTTTTTRTTKLDKRESRLRALMKTNSRIKELQALVDSGIELDEQQVRKLERRDRVLLEIDRLARVRNK